MIKYACNAFFSDYFLIPALDKFLMPGFMTKGNNGFVS